MHRQIERLESVNEMLSVALMANKGDDATIRRGVCDARQALELIIKAAQVNELLNRCYDYGDMSELEARDAQFTSGERQDALVRFVLSRGNNLNSAAHIRRYEEAGQFVKGRRVIDCACGPGYGSAILMAYGVEAMVGMDCDLETVEYAEQWYHQRGPIFVWAGADEIIDVSCAYQDGETDCLVSLETIEHLAEPEAFVDAVSELLGDDGIFVVSLPEPGSGNVYHLNDWTGDDVAARYSGRLHIIT